MATVRLRALTDWVVDRPSTVVLGAVVVTLGIGPMALLPTESPTYSGMANLGPTLFTYTVALVAAFAVMAVRMPRRLAYGSLTWIPLAIWVALGLIFWDHAPRTFSGAIQLALAGMAFATGWAAAQVRLTRLEDEPGDRWPPALGWAFALVAWVQLLAVGLAAVGLPLRRIEGVQALDILGRATGLTAHPGELAKLLFFCGMCALALPQRTDRQRWLAWATLAAVFLGVWLTQSRTVLVAVVGMVGLFLLLELTAGRWQRRDLAILGLTAALGLASLPWLISRFLADPGGGARGHVAGVAFEAIAAHPLLGVGANGYVAVVGRTDELTASGVPVHNMFLLSAAELGVTGALLLWAPLLLVLAAAVRRTWVTRGADLPARLVVSAAPGVLLIGMTGWGLMQGPYLLMFMLLFGYFGARIDIAAPHPASLVVHAGVVPQAPEPEEPAVVPATEADTADEAGPADVDETNVTVEPGPAEVEAASGLDTGAAAAGDGAETGAEVDPVGHTDAQSGPEATPEPGDAPGKDRPDVTAEADTTPAGESGKAGNHGRRR
ncbi:O-antigen ligase family protein [Catenuloplanes japonicus]|uniref:O-antigen ligase family protein n=1 Tax=Catenuloplanes japonicus TaxID=33876 RepID=UPI000526D353|nr:O-antigen ligase family protein [Catenuloplanes japonicus]